MLPGPSRGNKTVESLVHSGLQHSGLWLVTTGTVALCTLKYACVSTNSAEPHGNNSLYFLYLVVSAVVPRSLRTGLVTAAT